MLDHWNLAYVLFKALLGHYYKNFENYSLGNKMISAGFYPYMYMPTKFKLNILSITKVDRQIKFGTSLGCSVKNPILKKISKKYVQGKKCSHFDEHYIHIM